MPPAFRAHPDPTDIDAPVSTAAASPVRPAAIARQNRRRSSRLATPGRPGNRAGRRKHRSAPRPPSPRASPRPCEGAVYLAIRYTERPVEAGTEPTEGSVANSYHNAVAETVIGLLETEFIHRRGPRRGLEAMELATLAPKNRAQRRRAPPVQPPPPARAHRARRGGGRLPADGRRERSGITQTKSPPTNTGRLERPRSVTLGRPMPSRGTCRRRATGPSRAARPCRSTAASPCTCPSPNG